MPEPLINFDVGAIELIQSYLQHRREGLGNVCAAFI